MAAINRGILIPLFLPRRGDCNLLHAQNTQGQKCNRLIVTRVRTFHKPPQRKPLYCCSNLYIMQKLSANLIGILFLEVKRGKINTPTLN